MVRVSEVVKVMQARQDHAAYLAIKVTSVILV